MEEAEAITRRAVDGGLEGARFELFDVLYSVGKREEAEHLRRYGIGDEGAAV
jgi:hypothetical protein